MADAVSGSVAGVAFVDLDGTLTMENTFHLLLVSSLLAMRPLLVARIARAVLIRVLRGGPGRAEMKRKVLAAIGCECDSIQRDISQRVVRLAARGVSHNVIDEIDCFRRSGFRIVLATAAPVLYASDIARQFQMDGCLASEMPVVGTPWVELMGQAKADACMRWIELHGCTRSSEIAVLTDSPDDLPLVAHASRLVVQCSGDALVAMLAGVGNGSLSVKHIDPVSAEACGRPWLWTRCGPRATEAKSAVGPHRPFRVRAALLYVEPGVWARCEKAVGHCNPVMRVSCPPPPGILRRLTLLLGGREPDCCGAGSEWVCTRSRDERHAA